MEQPTPQKKDQAPSSEPVSLEQALEVIQELRRQLIALEAENQKLKDQLSQNSRNSSKPPSSDGYAKPSPKSRRQKSSRKSGGQKGHLGVTLEAVADPDRVIDHRVLTCRYCGRKLDPEPVREYEARQVVDINPVQPSVTEHRAQIRWCPYCGHLNKGEIPEGVTQAVQYGDRIRSWMVYFSHYQLLPYKRLQEMMRDVFGVSVSQGTIRNLHTRCYDKLDVFEVAVKDRLIHAEVAHYDETGMRVNKQLHWMHVACTDRLTLYHLDPKRGTRAMERMGLLPEFQGRAIHDHLPAYYRYACDHGLCNAHHLRELTYVLEQYGQQWAGQLIDCLVEAKQEVDQCQLTGGFHLPKERWVYYQRRYSRILRAGLTEVLLLQVPTSDLPKRGRKKQHKAKNLHDRLTRHKTEVLAFLEDFAVPFDNNQAERDLRMNKAKQKISGCFRSLTGGKQFARIRSYISTARKQTQNVVDALANALGGTPFMPQ
jgi:transposase